MICFLTAGESHGSFLGLIVDAFPADPLMDCDCLNEQLKKDKVDIVGAKEWLLKMIG